MRHKILVFNENKIPRFYTISNVKEYEGIDNVVIDPDCSRVMNFHQHFWKRSEENRQIIVPMTEEEMAAVRAKVTEYDSDAPVVLYKTVYKVPKWIFLIAPIIVLLELVRVFRC
jgi:hypothetical protein